MDREHLTVEMIHDAASAIVETLGMPPSARAQTLKRVAATINYHLRRNHQARKSHTKTTLACLHALGIDVEKLPSCVPNDSS